MALRKAIVSGTASGIGRAIATELLESNWCVTGIDRDPSDISHTNYAHVRDDLTDPETISSAVIQFDGIDGIVHAAGFMLTGSLGTLKPDDSLRMWKIHVLAAETLVNSAITRLNSGARVVLIGSRTSRGAGQKSQYAASKAALIGMSRSWAIELVQRGITVNIVSPAATLTPMLQDSKREGVPPKLPPMGRFVDPHEVAAMVCHLMGPHGGSITGQEIVLCAGSSL
jgi:3-oxoacyl-[acyl-carrier protein] reductase